jgi:hypothetical protein
VIASSGKSDFKFVYRVSRQARLFAIGQYLTFTGCLYETGHSSLQFAGHFRTREERFELLSETTTVLGENRKSENRQDEQDLQKLLARAEPIYIL